MIKYGQIKVQLIVRTSNEYSYIDIYKNKATRMKSFLSVLNKAEDMLNSWNERVWMLMMEKANVQRDKSVKFIFYGNI